MTDVNSSSQGGRDENNICEQYSFAAHNQAVQGMA